MIALTREMQQVVWLKARSKHVRCSDSRVLYGRLFEPLRYDDSFLLMFSDDLSLLLIISVFTNDHVQLHMSPNRHA